MRQALRFTKEATVGTYNASALPADIAHVRIVGDNAFPDRSVPNVYYVRDAAGSNRPVQVDYGTKTALLRFESLVYLSQAKLILPWGCNLVADGLSFKTPYTFTIDHLLQLEDTGRTVVYKRYTGCTAGDFMIRANNQGDGQKFTLSSTFWILGAADITNSDFTTPTLANFPSDHPAKFQLLAGNLSLGGARTSFKSLEIHVKNNTKGLYDESVYPQAIGWYGRDVSIKVDFRYKSQSDRTALENVTAQAATITLTDGTNTAAFDFKGQNIITSVGDSTPLGDAFYQGVSATSMVDPTPGTDLAVTVTP